MSDPGPTIALRGGTALRTQDLQAHLAALLELDNVGVLLGAGASVVANAEHAEKSFYKPGQTTATSESRPPKRTRRREISWRTSG